MTTKEVYAYGTKLTIDDGVTGRVIGVLIRGDVVQYDVEWISAADYKSAYMHETLVEELVRTEAQKRVLGFKGETE